MILDQLASLGRYARLHPAVPQVADFLRQHELAALSPGKHEIDGERLFVLIGRDEGRGREGARLEAHRRFIDIQLLLAGTEEIGWRPLDECQSISEPYSEDRDIMFFADPPRVWLPLSTESFLLFLPQDAHAPLAAREENTKAVFKLRVE